MIIRPALNEVRSAVEFDTDTLALLTTPRLKMSNSAPNIIPLIPASESIRFAVNE
jgi:hypothetical protein